MDRLNWYNRIRNWLLPFEGPPADSQFQIGEIVQCIDDSFPALETQVLTATWKPRGCMANAWINGRFRPRILARGMWFHDCSHISGIMFNETLLRRRRRKPEAGSWDDLEKIIEFNPTKEFLKV